MKSKTDKFFGVICLFAVLFLGGMVMHNLYLIFIPEHTTPPPEWGVACDGNGHFVSMWPGGYISDVKVFGSRQACITDEWKTVAILKRLEENPRPVYVFKPCEK